MQKIKLLVVAPYEGMNDIIRELLKDYDDVEADFFVANLNDAVKLLASLNLLEYDAVISRGGTASLISEKCSLNVYDVGLSSLDALRAIRLAQNFGQPFAIIGFENITKILHTLSELLQYDCHITTIAVESEAEIELRKLKSAGYEVVVCDVISAMIAPSIGIVPVIVTTGFEAVAQVLKQAIGFARSQIQTRQNLLHLTNVFQNSPYSCTVIDSKGNIVLSSLDSKDPAHISQYIREHLEELQTEQNRAFEKPWHGGFLSFFCAEQAVQNEQYRYLFARFHEHPKTNVSGSVRQISFAASEQPDFSYFIGSGKQESIRLCIEKYASSSSPVLITGEIGTGKDNAAYLLHRLSTFRNSIFYQIDCESATSKNWNYLFRHHNSPFMQNKHTIYFRHADALDSETVQSLVSEIASTALDKRNRLIFSFAVKPNESEGAKKSVRLLSSSLHLLTIHLLPLRERRDDIPLLCAHYINSLNASLGRQIAGFEPAALKAVQTFLWESNLIQFRRIVEALVLITSTAYISYENTMKLLSQESALWASGGTERFQFNLNQSLASINCDIARFVLHEENGNHSRAAERLGISRSTLWRMLSSQ